MKPAPSVKRVAIMSATNCVFGAVGLLALIFKGLFKSLSIIQPGGAISECFSRFPYCGLSNNPRLPDALSCDDGALLEPLSVSIHAFRKASVESGATCLVFGAGAVGLLCAAVVKIERQCTVVIADIDEGRVQFAIDEGFADVGFTVTPKKVSSVEEKLSFAKDMASSLGRLQLPGGGLVDRPGFVFECTGVDTCVQASIYVRGSLILL